MANYCAQCGHAVPSQAGVCPQCGAKVVEAYTGAEQPGFQQEAHKTGEEFTFSRTDEEMEQQGVSGENADSNEAEEGESALQPVAEKRNGSKKFSMNWLMATIAILLGLPVVLGLGMGMFFHWVTGMRCTGL